jgi:hypothetical protein
MFNSIRRRSRRAHCRLLYTLHIPYDISLSNILLFMQKPWECMTFARNYFNYHFKTFITQINSWLEIYVTNSNSNQSNLTAIVFGYYQSQTFQSFDIKEDEIDKRSFLKLFFFNKDSYFINLVNIISHKSVTNQIPPCFKDLSVPIISYSYNTPMATNIKTTTTCCRVSAWMTSRFILLIASVSFPFTDKLSLHDITANLNVINNSALRNVLVKVVKYSEPK